MTDDPTEQLERRGRAPVPSMDPAFADRLESKLRADHAGLSHHRRRSFAGLMPRLALGLVAVLAGVIGAVALTGRQAGVPVNVIDDPLPPATQPDRSGADGDVPVVVADATPTVAVVEPSATPLIAAAPTAETPAQEPAPSATVAPAPSPSPGVPAATATPVPEPTSTPTAVATPTVAPTATIATPTPTPLPTATSTPAPSATPTPTPTAEVQIADIALRCDARVAGDTVGVACNWRAPQIDRMLTSYEVLRSKNGGEAEIVSRQRASAERTYVDRNVTFGDEVIYLIRGFVDDQAVAASVRQVVNIAERDS